MKCKRAQTQRIALSTSQDYQIFHLGNNHCAIVKRILGGFKSRGTKKDQAKGAFGKQARLTKRRKK